MSCDSLSYNLRNPPHLFLKIPIGIFCILVLPIPPVLLAFRQFPIVIGIMHRQAITVQGATVDLNALGKKIKRLESLNISMVRMRGLEPPRRETPDPKSGASANSATSAYLITFAILKFISVIETIPNSVRYIVIACELTHHIIIVVRINLVNVIINNV